jgi:hypothetical protein
MFLRLSFLIKNQEISVGRLSLIHPLTGSYLRPRTRVTSPQFSIFAADSRRKGSAFLLLQDMDYQLSGRAERYFGIPAVLLIKLFQKS